MPAGLIRLQEALKASYTKRRAKGELKGVDPGAYVYGSKAVKSWKANHPAEMAAAKKREG